LLAERETLTRECRLDAQRLDTFLAEDFHEFGRSGGESTKAGTAQRVAQATASNDHAIATEDMRGQLVADGIVMVKYTAISNGQRTHRTSVWRKDPILGWRMFHHQGTPTH
jgi:ribonuclease HI